MIGARGFDVESRYQAAALGDIERMRLGIVATNADVAEPFWRALGYEPTGDVAPYESGPVSSTTAIWERALSVPTPR